MNELNLLNTQKFKIINNNNFKIISDSRNSEHNLDCLGKQIIKLNLVSNDEIIYNNPEKFEHPTKNDYVEIELQRETFEKEIILTIKDDSIDYFLKKHYLNIQNMIQKQKTIYNCVLQQIMGSTIISRYNILTTFIDLSFKHLILVYNNKKVIMFFYDEEDKENESEEIEEIKEENEENEDVRIEEIKEKEENEKVTKEEKQNKKKEDNEKEDNKKFGKKEINEEENNIKLIIEKKRNEGKIIEYNHNKFDNKIKNYNYDDWESLIDNDKDINLDCIVEIDYLNSLNNMALFDVDVPITEYYSVIGTSTSNNAILFKLFK